MNTEAQRKAGNAKRRRIGIILQKTAQPDSKTSIRRLFEKAHDEWRATLGLLPIVRNASGKPIGYRPRIA